MRRWQYLLFSIALAVIVLAVGTSSYLAIVRQERLEELEQIERDAELYLDELRQAREQLREAEERLEALEDMLLNLHQMQQIAERSAAPSRGGRITLATMPLTTPSGYTAARLERALADTGLAGLGHAFYGAEKKHGINGVILAAICAHESGWGTSRLAREKNNLAGLGAYDGRECACGMTFESREECVMYLARLLRDKPGTLEQVGRWYASDPRWAAKVAGCVRVSGDSGPFQNGNNQGGGRVKPTIMLVTEEVRYKFAVADYEEGGKTVKALLLRQSKDGYKITFRRKRRCSTNQSPGLVRQLSGAGLKFGRYELVKAGGHAGVWLGLSMEGEGVGR